ncbi:ZIP family metal transporter [Paenibacillus alginolyticus]|uniref:ZIP family metal transporter n=1 Tax=Paenibacillus alginolyticus TaxID=59839 RepID=UPI002DBDB733|nr:ZIP family metal transporter [Paenibacillus alginolyticus]MEC0143308.1 ZIP family metal transporter [Paenibacillus alginolyticus]
MSAGFFTFALSYIGMSAGGLFTFPFFKISTNMSQRLVMISVGVLISILLLEVLPESVSLGGLPQALLGSSIGYISARLSDLVLHRWSKRNSPLFIEASDHSNIWLISAMALHNLPVGLAIGTGLKGSQLQPVHEHLTITMIFHSIPEGLALGMLFISLGYRLPSLLFTYGLINVPILIGAALGYRLDESLNPFTISLLISIAIGTLMFVIIHEMLLPIKKQFGWKSSLLCFSIGASAGNVILIFTS